jgi:two-component system, chemotaxis family, sensor kinase CheA
MAKGLGPQLARVRNIGGATVLASGQVIPVLNVHDLIRSAILHSGDAPVVRPAGKSRAVKRILVVEDSITSRTLIKSILETSGYRVETAVDGIDALSKLGAGAFDAVVTDVDMPRLNGFDLISRIRSDKRISALPVVLVTSLDSRQDRERGFGVGAQAYIVKSGFDQGNLIEILGRLV